MEHMKTLTTYELLVKTCPKTSHALNFGHNQPHCCETMSVKMLFETLNAYTSLYLKRVRSMPKFYNAVLWLELPLTFQGRYVISQAASGLVLSQNYRAGCVQMLRGRMIIRLEDVSGLFLTESYFNFLLIVK